MPTPFESSPEESPTLAMAEALATEESGDYIQSQATFLHGINKLIRILRTTHEADHTVEEFTFEPTLRPVLDLPSSISDYCGSELVHANVTLNKGAGEEPLVSLTLGFERLRDGKYLTLLVSRDPEYTDMPGLEIPDVVLFDTKEEALHYSPKSDYVFVEGSEEPMPIPKLSKADVNKLLFSLALGREVHDDQGLQNATTVSSASYGVLVESLRKHADSWTRHVQYELANGKREIKWTEESSAGGETLKTCNFSYEAGDYDKKIVAAIDLTDGLDMKFTQRDVATDSRPFIPDTGDILRLIEVISELQQQYGTSSEIPIAPHEFDSQPTQRSVRWLEQEPDLDE